MKRLPRLAWRAFWRNPAGFMAMWMLIVCAAVPFAVVFGHVLIPERLVLRVTMLEVTSGAAHTVYFRRIVPRAFTAHWSVEIEDRQGCRGASPIDRPSTYSPDETRMKVFPLDRFTGAPCTPANGYNRMTACWFVPVGIWIKPICRQAAFLHYPG